ncbi:hypothetical protein GCM10009092_41360 [Bowmanella denitrificans]|uniref:Transposase n=1 Tax=Bowmanella denitrificans TaxID=366582 RepID=A0ABN0XTX4_9ALTE
MARRTGGPLDHFHLMALIFMQGLAEMASRVATAAQKWAAFAGTDLQLSLTLRATTISMLQGMFIGVKK